MNQIDNLTIRVVTYFTFMRMNTFSNIFVYMELMDMKSWNNSLGYLPL